MHDGSGMKLSHVWIYAGQATALHTSLAMVHRATPFFAVAVLHGIVCMDLCKSACWPPAGPVLCHSMASLYTLAVIVASPAIAVENLIIERSGYISSIYRYIVCTDQSSCLSGHSVLNASHSCQSPTQWLQCQVLDINWPLSSREPSYLSLV